MSNPVAVGGWGGGGGGELLDMIIMKVVIVQNYMNFQDIRATNF
jgi:uncharacterized membrane protein